MLQNRNGNNPKGIGMIEILVVVAILAITLTSLLGLVNFSLGAAALIKQTTQANSFAQEAVEQVRNFRDQTSWDNDGLGTLTADTAYHAEKTSDASPEWILVTGEESVGIFVRKIVFSRVWRDGNDNIADSGTEDGDTKKVTVIVSWEKKGRAHQIELITYLTNWQQ